MLHSPPTAARANRSVVTRQRFAGAGALLLVPLVPLLLRATVIQQGMQEPSTFASLAANVIAVLIAFWMRISIQTTLSF